MGNKDYVQIWEHIVLRTFAKWLPFSSHTTKNTMQDWLINKWINDIAV